MFDERPSAGVLQQMNELRESINKLEDRIRLLNQKQTGILSQTIVGLNSKEELEISIDEIKQHIRSLKPRIRDIDLSIRQDEQTGNYTGADLRIQRNQCEQLKRRLHDVLSLFNDTQSDYKRRVSSETSKLPILNNLMELLERVKRQLDMAGEYLTSDEVDRMIESNSEQIFYRQINPLTENARAALEDATNRHNEILRLERSISELNDLFVDVYELVALQVKIACIHQTSQFRTAWLIILPRMWSLLQNTLLMPTAMSSKP